MTLQPYMPQNEIAVMDATFALKRPRRVLEFGAGGSTVRWSGLVDLWVSVEHDPEWAERVRRATDVPDVYLAGGESFDSYTVPVASGYDLIFVDGLYRVQCIQHSPQWLADGGVVVLHDASRTEYAEAWDTYPHRVTLTKGDGRRNGLMVMWR